MNKKGSMELSVNSIVILVIAIVLMGLILGFVKTQMDNVTKRFTQNEPEAPVATASSPITLSRADLIVDADEKLGLKAQVYNTNTTNTIYGASPTFTCYGGLALTIATGGVIPKDIPAGNIAKYELVVQVGGAASGTYVCELVVSGLSTPVSEEFPATVNGYSPRISREITVKVQ